MTSVDRVHAGCYTDMERAVTLMDVLSFEGVLQQVLERLGFQSTIALGCCCKTLHSSILQDSHIWRMFFQRAYPAASTKHTSFHKAVPQNSNPGSTSTPAVPNSLAGSSPEFHPPANAAHRDFSYLATSPMAQHLSNCATMNALLENLKFRAVFSICVSASHTAPLQPFAVLGGMNALGAAVEMELEDDLGGAGRPIDNLTGLPWPVLGDQWRREPVLRQLQMPNAQRNRRATDSLTWVYKYDTRYFFFLDTYKWQGHVAVNEEPLIVFSLVLNVVPLSWSVLCRLEYVFYIQYI